MNKLLIATAAVALATAGTAGAADLPVKAPPYVPPALTWTGCYVGAGLGYGMWNQDHYTETTVALTALEPSTTSGGRGWLGRVGVGCDYQVAPSFVIGAFGDYDFMSLKGTWADPLAAGPAVVANEKESGAWAAGLRVGYLPYPNLLTFLSGGWTQTRFDQFNFATNTLPAIALTTGIQAQTYSGWFLGGGTEYRLPWWQNLTWKTEYRFSSYQARDVAEVVLATGAGIGLSDNMQKNVQTVTTSLVWRFNFGGPVVARY